MHFGHLRYIGKEVGRLVCRGGWIGSWVRSLIGRYPTTKKRRKMYFISFFQFLILWSYHNHPQGGLATFGYRPDMKVKRLIKIFLYPGYLLEHCVETVKV
jgi:hypothetical protein